MARVSGVKSHTDRIERVVGPEGVKTIGRALYAGGQLIEIEAEISITAGSVSGKGHVPSKPGEPPNRDSGVLDGNIETVQVRPLKVEVTSNAPYANALENGTSKMAARPYMRPAAEKRRGEVADLVQGAVNKVLRVGG